MPIPKRKCKFFLVGTGVVGSNLLAQIEEGRDILLERYGIEIRVVGIANSKKMLLDPKGLSLNDWNLCAKEEMSWEHYLEEMFHAHLSHPVFMDCTSNQEIADSYAEILGYAIPIVTPNKKANSGSFAMYESLREIEKEKGAGFYYDANVGAGLPILSTIESLKKAGDEIVRIEAVFSGTLSYLFNSFTEGVIFSKLVKKAQEKGYTEPDPRDDLNGMDVARKLLIAAREAGFTLEMNEIALDPFLPDECFEAESVDSFYDKLAEFDSVMTAQREKAEMEGKRLCFIATLENGKGEIALRAVGKDHPFYHLSGNDNIVSITTKHYSKNPIVIQGPGAGAEVTAAKVLEGIVESVL